MKKRKSVATNVESVLQRTLKEQESVHSQYPWQHSSALSFFRTFFYLLVFMVFTDACHNPLDGLTIGLKDPIQDGVVECRFYDPAGNPLPTDNLVKIAGPAASRVVTTLNTTKYKINSDGNLLLAASPTAILSPQDPFQFTVVVETPDYLAVVQPFVPRMVADKRVRSGGSICSSRPERSMRPAQQEALAPMEQWLPAWA